MAEYVTREEFEARVGVLEGEVDGEKLVTRYILDQTRRNGDDLAAVKTRLDRLERKVDDLGKDTLTVKTSLQDLVRNLPGMISQVLREVLQERDTRR